MDALFECRFNIRLITGVINSFINRDNDSAKVLSCFFSISGALIGVMSGAIVSSVVPVFAATIISTFFGISFIFGGALLGKAIGNKYPVFNCRK